MVVTDSMCFSDRPLSGIYVKHENMESFGP